MKKYICSNCGFRSRLQVESVKHEKTGAVHHRCRNCDTVAYPTKLVLQSVMRSYLIKTRLNFSIK